jgi:hypothetical protein
MIYGIRTNDLWMLLDWVLGGLSCGIFGYLLGRRGYGFGRGHDTPDPVTPPGEEVVVPDYLPESWQEELYKLRRETYK